VVGAVIAGVLLGSVPALAQTPPAADQGPRFPFGPGQAAPEAEGPPSSSAAPSAPGQGPFAAPVPGGRARPEFAPAPAPDRGGCNYDLRGGWNVDGRQTDPWDYRYDSNIQVRQYRNWLQIEQPSDGVSYYGVCRGNQIELDVYFHGRFIGYQDGTIGGNNGGGGGGRWWGGGGESGLRVRSEWSTFSPSFATGRETWRRWGY